MTKLIPSWTQSFANEKHEGNVPVSWSRPHATGADCARREGVYRSVARLDIQTQEIEKERIYQVECVASIKIISGWLKLSVMVFCIRFSHPRH